MQNSPIDNKRHVNRRSFLRRGALGTGAVVGIACLPEHAAAFDDGNNSSLNRGDIAILTFLSALEQVEADLWIQYAELGGATNQGLSPIDLKLNGKAIKTGLSSGYIAALEVLDGDMPQYIADNTDDEISHHQFLNNYLVSNGAPPVDLSRLAVLPPSKVTGVPQNGRLTSLQRLTIDTTWWTRYRSDSANPDLGGSFENAVPALVGRPHTAIPITDADALLNPDGSIRTMYKPLQALRVFISHLSSRVAVVFGLRQKSVVETERQFRHGTVGIIIASRTNQGTNTSPNMAKLQPAPAACSTQELTFASVAARSSQTGAI
jgi:hypothetical protein